MVVISAAIPAILLAQQFGLFLGLEISFYDWAVYILVLNTSVLMLLSRMIAGTISYPYSNSCFRNYSRNRCNSVFSHEFRKSVERMTQVITEAQSRQNHDMSAVIFMEHEKEQNQEDLMASSVESDFISQKDIYLKLA